MSRLPSSSGSSLLPGAVLRLDGSAPTATGALWSDAAPIIWDSGDRVQAVYSGLLRFTGWHTPFDGLLAALATPPPGEDDGRAAWGAALLKARKEYDAHQLLYFADWCADRGFVTWERIARDEAERIRPDPVAAHAVGEDFA